MDTKRQARLGINTVSSIVETNWQCGWQEFDSHNDDGVDGAILMRRGSIRPVDTGGVVFAQVKCGESYVRKQKQHPDSICLALGADYVTSHIPRWKRLPGPTVLIFVNDPASRKNALSWWVQLRPESIAPTNSGIILIPKSQRFGHHAKGPFQKLCGHQAQDNELPKIQMSVDELLPMSLGDGPPLRHSAWKFYKRWREEKDRTHPSLGKVLVNRVGWKHLTRPGRSLHRIINSCLLLPVAMKMVELGLPTSYLGRGKQRTTTSSSRVVDYLGIRASVSFPHRQSSVVQVVLKRERLLIPHVRTKVWFYSVFERRRGTK